MRLANIHPATYLLLALATSACADSNRTDTSPQDAGEADAPPQPALPSPLATVHDVDGLDPDCTFFEGREVPFGEDVGGGLSADGVLAYAEGSHRDTIRWRPSSWIEISAQGDSALYVAIERGGHARLFERADGQTFPQCPRWLAIDVHVALQSEDGALNEAFDAVLWSTRPDVAIVFAQTPELGLAGTLSSQYKGPANGSRDSYRVELGVSEHGINGSLALHRASGSAGNSGWQREYFAYWGPGECQPSELRTVALDTSIQLGAGRPSSMSAGELLDMLGAVSPLSIDWNDGTSSAATIAFVPENDGACASPTMSSLETPQLVVPGELVIKSEDGRIDAAWPGRLATVLLEDSEDTALEYHLYTARPYAAPEELTTPAELGFPAVDADAGPFDVVADLVVRGDPAAITGRFVLHVREDVCSTNRCMVAVEGGNLVH